MGVSEQGTVKGVMASLFRSLGRPQGQGFARRLLASIEEVKIGTEAGLYLGKQPALKLEPERIAKVGERIIRGLFFHENSYPVPEGYEVVACIQQFGIDPILDKLRGLQFPEVRVVQDGVFCYTFKETGEDPNSTVWLALFYGNVHLVGFTRRHPESRAVAYHL